MAEPIVRLHTVISGGQTGADLAGLLAAERLGLRTGGEAPRGYRTEAGPQPILGTRFGLTEGETPNYNHRTLRNVQASDGTLILAANPGSAGTVFTIRQAVKYGKPCRIVDPFTDPPEATARWIIGAGIGTLNVAGNRESVAPGIARAGRDFLHAAFLSAMHIKQLATLPPTIKGDIFAGGHHVLVNPVNTVGVMGAGLAAAFKERFPLMFSDYAEACSDGWLASGVVHSWSCPDTGVVILNVPTKNDWRMPSTYPIVEAGLAGLRHQLQLLGRASVGVPALGCGKGGLSWALIEPITRGWLMDVDAEIHLYDPQ